MAVIDIKNCTVTIQDGTTPTALSLTVKIGEGNLVYTLRRNIEYILDRGVIDAVREGDQVPVDVRLDAVWEYIKGSSGSGTPTIADALRQTGEASAWVSTDADACNPYAVDIILANLPVPADCGDRETITLADFRWEEQPFDLRAGTISITGKCNITAPTVVRVAQ